MVVSGNPVQVWNSDIAFTGTNDLDLGTGSVTMNGLANSTNRNVTVGGSTLTIGGIIADGVSGNNGITKAGAGTLALNGANTFTGPVTINQGTVKVGNATALGSNTVPGTVVAAGAALDVGGFATANVATGLSGPINISGTAVGGHGALPIPAHWRNKTRFKELSLSPPTLPWAERADLIFAAAALA